MRLVHEYNRKKVERWLLKQRLQKIATLEEYDKQRMLSDRRMLTDEYEYLGDFLMFDDPAAAESYFKKALDIYLTEPSLREDKATISTLHSRIEYALNLQGLN